MAPSRTSPRRPGRPVEARPREAAIEATLDLDVDFAAREELRTEISAKFTPERLDGDLSASGLELVALYTDPDDLFAVSLSRPA